MTRSRACSICAGGADQEHVRRTAFGRKRHHERRRPATAIRNRCGRSTDRCPSGSAPAAARNAFSDADPDRRAWPAPRRSRPWRSACRARIELDVGDVAKVADRRHAVPGEHVERVRQRKPPVGRDVGRGAHIVPQAIERELEAVVGNVEAAGARAREEIGHVAVEPRVLAARRPETERAFISLAGEHDLDRLGDALVDIGVDRELARRAPSR